MMRSRRRKRKKNGRAGVILTVVLSVILLAVAALLVYVLFIRPNRHQLPSDISTTDPSDTSETPADTGTDEPSSGSSFDPEGPYREVLLQARRMCDMYDYDNALAYLSVNVPNYAEVPEANALASVIKAEKTKAVVWSDNTKITHIFFHTLVADEDKAFSSYKKDDYNEVMTTIGEFRKIIDILYEKGYVLVHLSDIAAITKNDDGTETMKMQPILLPAGKTPFVLSVDDVSYYDYMTGTGFANRLVIDEDGRVVCEMDQDDGTSVRGEFDVMPILDAFVEEHPDFSYRGAKGTIALTGYNGVLGYRTSDITYGPGNDTWPSAHSYDNPDIEADKVKAKEVAEALKASGWKFASHTWGHMNMNNVKGADGTPTERFYRDTRWWDDEVRPIVGDTDIIIFAYGADIGSWRGYTDDNQMYAHLKADGFNYYCNVDSSTHTWVQLNATAGGSGYLRQARRNLDGQLMYKAIVYPEKEILTDLFDPLEVLSRKRPLPVKGVVIPEGYEPTWPADGAE